MAMHEWEMVEESGPTWRMRVPGGWIYQVSGDQLCFVPLPPHWAGPSEPEDLKESVPAEAGALG